MLDLDKDYKSDFNYSHEYFDNDHPNQWVKYTNPTSVVDVGYKLNSYGYRCDEFDLQSELPIVFMGCSHTFGLGLPLEDTWAYKTISNIRAKTNKTIPYWNLARNGSSIDLQFWNLNKHIEQLKPKFIFFLIPSIYRRLPYFDNKFHEFQVNENQPSELYLPLAVQKAAGLFVNKSYAIFETYKYFMLINALCERHGTQLLFQYSDIYEGENSYTFFRDHNNYSMFKKLDTHWVDMRTNGVNDRRLDYARDRMHRGPLSNKAFADALWQEINTYF
jgi:hypothetical protein